MYKRLLILLISPILFFSQSYAQDYEKANALLEAGEYAKAAIEYEKVIPWLIDELGENDTTGLPAYYYLLGSAYYYSDQVEKAIETHLSNHNYCIQNFKGCSEMDLNSLNQLCEIATNQGDNNSIIELRKEIVNCRLLSTPTHENLLELGYAYNDLGVANYTLGNDSNAVENYINALSILVKELGQNNIDIVNIKVNLASSYIYLKKYNKAREAYKSAFETLYKLNPENYNTSIKTMSNLSQELVDFLLFEEAKHALFIDIETKSKIISKSDTSLINAYLDLGSVFYYLDDNNNASLSYDSSATIIDLNFTEQTNDWAFWHGYLGYSYDLIKNWDKTILSSKKAFSFYEKDSEEYLSAYLMTNNTLLSALLKQQKYNEALVHSDIKLKHYTEDLKNKENYHLYISAVTENAEILSYLHQNEKAIDIIKESLPQTEKFIGKGIEYINLLDLLAITYTTNSQFKEAIETTEERLTLLKTIGSEQNPDYGVALNDLGNIYFQKGEYIKALESYEKAAKNFTDDIYLNQANSINNIALCYIELANYKKAIEYFSKAKNIHNNHSTDNIHYCTLLINEARAQFEVQEITLSEKLYNEAKEITLRIQGKESDLYVTIQNSLGNLYLQTNRFMEAAEAYVESVELIKTVYAKNDPVILDLLGNYSHALCALQKFDLGIEIMEKIRERLILNNGKQNPKSMHNALNLGFAYHSNNQDDKAYQLVNDQFETIDNNINYNLKYLNEGESIEYLKRMNLYYSICYTYLMDKGDTHPELVAKGLNSLLQIKGKLLHSNTALKNQIMSSKNEQLIETYNLWLETLKSIESIQTMSNIDLKLLDKTIKESDRLEKSLTDGSKDFAKALTQKYDWKDVQESLNNEEVVIEFIQFQHQEKFISDTATFGAFIFDKNSEYPFFIEVCQVQDLVDIIGEYGGNNLSYIQGIYGKSGEKSNLYDLLWKPLTKYLPANAKVIISPNGLLHKISFSGISDGNQFMNQKYNIRLVNSITTLLNKETELTKLDPVILGGIDYDYNVDKDVDHIWTYLKGTKIESKEIEQKFKDQGIQPSYFTAGEANESKLSQVLPTKNIAHIATHGFFYPKPSLAEEIVTNEVITDEDVVFRGGTRGLGYNFYVTNKNPMMRSGIALSGANQVWNNTDIDLANDGVLTAQDIAIMDLRKLDLMVLSACETGLGDIEGSEGVYGLQRSLKMAGVDNIIMSLWQVPDNETKEFMIQFYSFLLETKDIKASFRKAQLAMSKKYDAFYWAAFVLI